jgi:hypothetical protein
VIVSYRVAGERFTLSGTRQKQDEARTLLGKLTRQAEQRRRAAMNPKRTVSDLLDDYVKRSGSWSSTTARQFQSLRNRHYDPMWGARTVGSFNFSEVEDWIRDLARGQGTASRPLERATLQRILNPLALAYDRALKLEWDDRNPFRQVSIDECLAGESTDDDDFVDEVVPKRSPALDEALRALKELADDEVTQTAC